MARGKKKESALTPEEKLAQALVPVEEQPYKVPENWCWVRLGSLGYTNIGLTYKPANISPTGTIVLRSSNIQNGQMDYSDIVSVDMDIPESKMSQKGDILICARNGSKALVGKTAIIDRNGMSYGAFMAIFRSPYNSLIYHYLNSHYFRDIIDHDVGTTTINQITQSLIKELPFPLPPFAEQQRIVDRIEYLLAKLDEAKEKVQSVLDSFETRKAAILHKAFTGELTAKWRAEHDMALEGWYNTTVGDLFDVFSGKGFKEKEYSSSGVKLLRISNVTYDELVWEDTKYLPVEYLETVPELVLRPGDIVMALNRPITNGKLKVSIVDDQEYYILYQRVGCLRKRDPLNSTQYLQYALLSQAFIHQVESHLQGSDQPYINLPPLKSLTISMCSEHEQMEIVRILDSLFAKEQQAREAAEAVLEKIDLLKKSILARAFRGELGTNDPAEESAVELLKTIL